MFTFSFKKIKTMNNLVDILLDFNKILVVHTHTHRVQNTREKKYI